MKIRCWIFVCFYPLFSFLIHSSHYHKLGRCSRDKHALCWQSWQRGRLIDTSFCGLPHYSNNNIILSVLLSDTHPGQMYINTNTSYIIKVPAAAASTTSLSFPRGGVSSIVQSSLLSNQIMRDVDVPVRSPSPHVISHLISSWTEFIPHRSANVQLHWQNDHCHSCWQFSVKES